MQAFLLCKTQVPPSGHMAQSERLTPACMSTTPTKEYQEHCCFIASAFLWRKFNSSQDSVFPLYGWKGRRANRGQTTLIHFRSVILNVIQQHCRALVGVKKTHQKQKFNRNRKRHCVQNDTDSLYGLNDNQLLCVCQHHFIFFCKCSCKWDYEFFGTFSIIRVKLWTIISHEYLHNTQNLEPPQWAGMAGDGSHLIMHYPMLI